VETRPARETAASPMVMGKEVTTLRKANAYKALGLKTEAEQQRISNIIQSENLADLDLQKIAASLALAEKGSGEYRRIAIHKLKEYVRDRRQDESFDKTNDRLLGASLDVLSRIDFKSIGDKDLVKDTKRELGQWLEGKWMTAPATTAAILVGLHKNPLIRYETASLGDKLFKDILEEKGINKDSWKKLEHSLAGKEKAVSKDKYDPWVINPPSSDVDLAELDDISRKQGVDRIIKRSVYGEVMDQDPRKYAEVTDRLDAIKEVPQFIKKTLKESPDFGVDPHQIESIYVAGSFPWGHQMESPTDLDILVVTKGDNHLDDYTVNYTVTQISPELRQLTMTITWPD